MQLLLLSLSLTALCSFSLVESASHALKLHTGESAKLRDIKHILEQFGHTPFDSDIFWTSAAIHEMRSPRKPYVSNITVNTGHFAQAIHDIHTIIYKNKTRQKNISQKFYTVLLCEILDRRLNGTTKKSRFFFEEPATKSLSLEMSKSDTSSPRTSEWTHKVVNSGSSPELITDELSYNDPSELSSFILDEPYEQ